MIKISVFCRELTDSFLRQMIQLGVDALDFGGGDFFPGVKEQGYPDLDELIKVKRRIQSWGMEMNRVTLPDVTAEFIDDGPGAGGVLDSIATALRVYAEAGVPIARQRVAGDMMPGVTAFRVLHRGGYLSRGDSVNLAGDRVPTPTLREMEAWWKRFHMVFERLVPVADEYGIKLAIHPSDTPFPDTAFGGLGMHRVIDAFPSKQVGFVYCIGTRAEAGGTPLILDEIQNYGRKGKLFTCHFRNVRGSLATAGGFEETLLDDGDMNMFRVLLALDDVGFDGCINPDHIPPLEGDTRGASLGMAYSVGYIKALLAALAALPKRGYV